MKHFKLYFTSLFACIFLALIFLSSCSKDDGASVPQVNDLAPDSASGGSVLTLTGTGLSDIRTIIFEKDSIPASFNPVFNTDHALIFRVPDTAFGGKQKITFTNKYGRSVSVPFNVVALPTVSEASIYEFAAGTEITLKGNNLETVSKVTIHGTSDEATIVSQDHRTLVLEMPSTSVSRASLDITNASGDITTKQEFINVDQAFQIFTEGFGTGVDDWSWSTTSVSSDYSILGQKSLKSVYGVSWQAVSLNFDTPVDASQYTYLTFWVKGGSEDNQIDVKSPDGGSPETITVPANEWSYFKFKTSGFITGFQMERLSFQMHGPDDGEQTLYFDDILLVK